MGTSYPFIGLRDRLSFLERIWANLDMRKRRLQPRIETAQVKPRSRDARAWTKIQPMVLPRM